VHILGREVSQHQLVVSKLTVVIAAPHPQTRDDICCFVPSADHERAAQTESSHIRLVHDRVYELALEDERGTTCEREKHEELAREVQDSRQRHGYRGDHGRHDHACN
jgi:hypothetical protein